MDSEQFKQKSCDQRKEIDLLKQRSIPLSERDLSIVAAFDCSKKQRMKSIRRFELRRELCSLIHNHISPSPTSNQPINMIFDTFSSLFISSNKPPRDQLPSNKSSSNSVQVRVVAGEGSSSRSDFWRHISLNSSFALAPFGRGLDTHRVWEVLQLGGIPIVLSSSLDRLYQTFPVLIVHSWREVFVSQSYLEKKKEEIIVKFGSPFNSDVQRRLTLDYWVNLIKTGNTQ